MAALDIVDRDRAEGLIVGAAVDEYDRHTRVAQAREGSEIVELAALTVLQGRAAGEGLVARERGERPDAVFAANDLLAVGLMQALSLLADVRVPDDIALIGYDDIDFAAATVVPLSSIRQPAHLIGYTAVDLLLRQLAAPGDDHERNVRFRPELVVRASTAG